MPRFLIYPIILMVILVACSTPEPNSPIVLQREAAGFTLLDPTPEGAAEMPNGTSSLVIEGETTVHILAFEGQIFSISFTRRHGGGENISSIIDDALRRFGEPAYSDSTVYRFEDEATIATLRIGRKNYTLLLSDKPLIEKALGRQQSVVQIPRGKSVEVDGYQRGNEWEDALPLGVIPVEEDWNVSVFAKHDGENLLVLFLNVQPEEEKYIVTEVLVDADCSQSLEWDSDDFWLHASFNDCEAIGAYNVWECSPEKPDWQANNFPLMPPGQVEYSISFEKLGITDSSGVRIGLAINVTDTQERWLFWPAEAKLESPATWALVYLE